MPAAPAPEPAAAQECGGKQAPHDRPASDWSSVSAARAIRLQRRQQRDAAYRDAQQAHGLRVIVPRGGDEAGVIRDPRIGRTQRQCRLGVHGGLVESVQAVEHPCQRIVAVDVAAHRQLGPARDRASRIRAHDRR